MAPYSYYYIIVLATIPGVSLWLINLLYIRLKSRSVFGQIFTKGTLEHEQIMKIARTRNLIITILILTFLMANLVWSIILLLSFNAPSVIGLLIVAPILIIISFLFMITYARSKFIERHPPEDNKKGKSDKEDDSWLS